MGYAIRRLANALRGLAIKSKKREGEKTKNLMKGVQSREVGIAI